MKLFSKQLLFIVIAVVILATGAVLIFAISSKGIPPIALWKLDEGSGSSVYDSRNNVAVGRLVNSDASPATSTMWVSGVFGTALNFDGVNDYVAIGSISSTSSGSISAWIKPSGTYTGSQVVAAAVSAAGANESVRYELGARGAAICASGDWFTALGNGTTYQFVCSGQVYNSTNFPSGVWVHLSVTYDGSNVRFYKNGALVSTVAQTVSAAGDAQPFSIGRTGGYNGGYFSGSIDDVRIYNYARNADQVRQDYNAGKALYAGPRAVDCESNPADCVNKGLVAYWDLDEMSGQTAKDKTGNNNNATLGANSSPAGDDPTWSRGIQPLSGGKTGGGGLYFDGSNDYAVVSDADSLRGMSELTVSAWVKLNAYVGTQGARIVQKEAAAIGDNGSYWLRETPSNDAVPNTFGFAIQDTTTAFKEIKDTATPSLDVWYHIVGVYKAGDFMKMYRNGVEISTSSAAGYGAISAEPYNLFVGSTGTPGRFFRGTIDNVRVYNRALSVAEVRYLYNQAGPVVWWKFDESSWASSSGEVKDSAGSYNGAGVNGANTTSTAVFGMAGVFNGSDDYVDVGTVSISDNVPWSVSLWINVSSFASYRGIYGNAYTASNYTRLMLNNVGNIYLYNDANSSADWTSTGLAAGSWQHLAVTCDGQTTANCYAYVNGKALAVKTLANSSQTIKKIGNYGTASEGVFSGLIDNFRIYNYALTADQVRRDYNGGKALYAGGGSIPSGISCDTNPAACIADGLVAYWDLDEMSGQTAKDKTGNNNNATLGANSSPAGDDPTWSRGIQPLSGGKTGGGGLYFDGSNDYATGTLSTLVAPYSVAGWVKIDSTYPASEGRYFFCLNSGGNVPCFSPHYYNSSKPLIYLNTSNYRYGSTDLNDSRWHHIVFIVTGSGQSDISNAKIYIDGKEETYGTTLATDSPVSPGTNFSIGSGKYKGWLDGVRVYNRVLSAAEVRYQYNQSKPVAHWKMDEGMVGGTNLDMNYLYYAQAANSSVHDITTQDISFSAWVKIDSGVTNQQFVIAKRQTGAHYNFQIRTTTQVGLFHISDGTDEFYVYGNTALNDNKWHHVAGVIDRDTQANCKIYVDGLLDGTMGYYGTLANVDSLTNGNKLTLGAFGDGVTAILKGQVRDVKLYYANNDHWTDAQILYQATHPMDYSSSAGTLTEYWQTNEGSGTTLKGSSGRNLTLSSANAWSYETSCDNFLSSVYDYSGNANTGTLYLAGSPATSTAWVEGKYSCALNLDGTDDYVNIPDPVLGSTAMTVCAWAKKTAYVQYQGIVTDYAAVDGGRNWILGYENPENTIRFYSGDGINVDSQTITGFTANQWHFVCGVFDGSQDLLAIYLDNDYQSKTTAINNIGSTISTYHYIGKYSSGFEFNGLIDDVRIYNYALNRDQLRQVYDEGAALRIGPSE
ncbi:MAG: LamG domain-containing protein [Candidatus Pacebacteria bacterium]|nr:LamG domain-containing protein [Candidatus Paceibacterota bacterium]